MNKIERYIELKKEMRVQFGGPKDWVLFEINDRGDLMIKQAEAGQTNIYLAPEYVHLLRAWLNSLFEVKDATPNPRM